MLRISKVVDSFRGTTSREVALLKDLTFRLTVAIQDGDLKGDRRGTAKDTRKDRYVDRWSKGALSTMYLCPPTSSHSK